MGCGAATPGCAASGVPDFGCCASGLPGFTTSAAGSIAAGFAAGGITVPFGTTLEPGFGIALTGPVTGGGGCAWKTAADAAAGCAIASFGAGGSTALCTPPTTTGAGSTFSIVAGRAGSTGFANAACVM